MYRSQMFGPTGMALMTLLILTSSLIQASSQVITVNFTVTPGNLTVAETSTANITYNCSVQVDPMDNRILQRHWSLQFPDTPGSFSTMDFDNSVALQERGITYDEVTSSLTVQSVMGNNGTLLRCTVRPNGITEISEPVQLTLAGPPLPPAPVLEILCASQIEVRWDVPYSNENFPIENYTIWISNMSSNALLESNDTMQNSFIYELVGTDQATSCHPLNFSVAAINSVGMSGPGMIRGGFPIAPLPFESDREIKVDVTFLRDGTPVAEISFEAPFICDFQTSSYTIDIEDTTQPESVFEHTGTYNGSSRMIVVEVLAGLLATNSNYVVTVKVSDESYDGNVTASTTFDTAFVIGNPASSGVEGIEIYAGVAGGLVALLLISITLVAMVFIYTRRRKHHTQAPGSTMDKRLNNSISNRPDQLDNDLFIIPPRPPETTPAHAATPVYEAINEYQVNQEEARNTAALSRQWQDYRKLQQLDRERTQKDELEDSTYQVMNSASQDAAGAPNLPSYPGLPPQLHANNDHPVTWPSQGASNQPHTPDNNYPYRYHFRPIPPSSAAALLVSPPARDRQNDPNFQYYTVNQTFGDAPAPPIDQEEEDGEAVGGGGGGGGRVGYGGGEQDYTFMSEAGTLAGLTTERSNSVSQPRKMRIGVPGIDKNILVSEC